MSDVDEEFEWRRHASHDDLVTHAANTWIESVEYEAARVAQGTFRFQDTPFLSRCLPPILVEKYDLAFLAHFACVARDLATRVQACPEDPWPSCVAEELALLAIGDQAALMAPDELLPTVEPFDAEAYLETRMQDDDVRLLWSPAGRQAIALDVLDFVNLDLASWFVPFVNATHPVAAMPSRAETADWIKLNSYGPAADDT